jgi:hypothetical protein
VRRLGRRPDETGVAMPMHRVLVHVSSTKSCLSCFLRWGTFARPNPLLFLHFLPHVRGLFGVAGALCPSAIVVIVVHRV